MCENETPVRIVTNFCDVITSANFYDYRLLRLGVAEVKFWASALTCVVALTTLSHYCATLALLCDCVITGWLSGWTGKA